MSGGEVRGRVRRRGRGRNRRWDGGRDLKRVSEGLHRQWTWTASGRIKGDDDLVYVHV